MKDALVLFAKAPIPGEVKTRLCPPLTPDEAASLHGSFVLDASERSRAAKLDRFLACAPSSEHVFFKILGARQGVRLIDQKGEDLGARMAAAFQTVFALGYGRVLIAGTDLPTLPASLYGQALDLLRTHDAVVAPALDGGYVLIGLTRPHPDLFTGIAWSTEQVFEQTRAKATTLGLKMGMLPAVRDVDTVDDLRALIKEMHATLSKRTAGALRHLAGRYRQALT